MQPVARAFITLFKTLPSKEQKEVMKWIQKNELSFIENEKRERQDFADLSAMSLNGAYGDNEPEYCIELNPQFKK